MTSPSNCTLESKLNLLRCLWQPKLDSEAKFKSTTGALYGLREQKELCYRYHLYLSVCQRLPFGVSEIDPKGSYVDGSHVYAEVEMCPVP
jgi:hypothetical protein